MSLISRTQFALDHRWAPARMSDYLDGQLAVQRRVRMERHLDHCGECTRLLGDLRRIVTGLHRLPAAPDAAFDTNGTVAAVWARLSSPPAAD